MADNKTVPTSASVDDYLASVEHPTRQKDSLAVCAMMQEVTGAPPVMWGDALVGFGQYHYRYDSGREGDFFKTGFAPRKSNLVIYVMPGFGDYDDILGRLGPHRTGSSCLYLTRLERIDAGVLRELVARSWADMTAQYG